MNQQYEQANLFDGDSDKSRDDLESKSFTPRVKAVRKTKSCVFCAIVRGETKARIVIDEDDFVGFLDTRPVFPGHVLLVPRLHIQTFEQLPLALAHSLVRTVQRVQVAIEAAVDADGSLHIVNNVVSQSVPHLHYHIIPRKKKDGLRFWLGPRVGYANDEEADLIAEKVRSIVAMNDSAEARAADS